MFSILEAYKTLHPCLRYLSNAVINIEEFLEKKSSDDKDQFFSYIYEGFTSYMNYNNILHSQVFTGDRILYNLCNNLATFLTNMTTVNLGLSEKLNQNQFKKLSKDLDKLANEILDIIFDTKRCIQPILLNILVEDSLLDLSYDMIKNEFIHRKNFRTLLVKYYLFEDKRFIDIYKKVIFNFSLQDKNEAGQSIYEIFKEDFYANYS
jgi:hypothetical protein